MRLTCFAGAHNTIVTARAGKDLVSCLVSGLLTIGPRFGGAVDDAARYFQDACDRGKPFTHVVHVISTDQPPGMQQTVNVITVSQSPSMQQVVVCN